MTLVLGFSEAQTAPEAAAGARGDALLNVLLAAGWSPGGLSTGRTGTCWAEHGQGWQ